MIKIIKPIDVDVSKENTYVYILAKQNDAVSRYLQINMLNEGEPVDISSATSAVLTAVKSDKTVTLTNGVISKGVVTVELTKQTLAADGPVTCFLSVHSNGSILSTMDFTIDVQGTNVDDDSIISSDEYTAFQDALKTIGNLNELKTEVEQAKTEALQAKNDIEAQFPVTPEKTDFIRPDYVIENITSNVNPGTVNPETGEVEMIDKQNQVSDYIRVDRTKRFYLKADTCTVYEYKDNAYLGKQAQIIPREVGSNPEFDDYEVRFQDKDTNQIIIQCPMGKWFLLEPYTVYARLQMPNLVVDGNQLDDGTVTEGKLSEAVQTKLNTPGGLTEVNTGDIVDAAVTMPKLGEDVKAELSGIHALTQRDGKWYDRQGVWYGLDESALTATIVGNEYTGANNGHVVLPVAVSANDQIYTVTRIVDMAFRSCLALKSLEICSRISSISMQTFGECSNLKSVSLPDSLTEIGNGAFYQCSIPSVTVPRGVTSIADYAFDGNAATLYIDNCEGEVNIGIWNGNQVYLRMKPNNYYTKTETDSLIEGNWRKITEMTLAEAAVVSVTADAENQPFSLKRFNITVTKPGVEGDTASGYLWLKSTFNNLPKPVVQSNTHSGTLGVKYRICGDMAAHWETDISSSGAQEPSDNTTAQVYRYPLGTRPEVYALGREPITNFILTWGYSDALPAGTSIEIWGMDA